MRALIQRVSAASVKSEGMLLGRIARGYVVLVGVGVKDTEAQADWLAKKILDLRLFPDAAGKLDRSLLEVSGGVLLISQFTLYADARRGRRPSFTEAALPGKALPLYEFMRERLRALGAPVETGRFGAQMELEIHNDGPLTLWLEREA